MCFLPPMFLCCRHYNPNAGHGDGEAIAAIPDATVGGGFDHREPFVGDAGMRFELDPSRADDFAQVMQMRRVVAERSESLKRGKT